MKINHKEMMDLAYEVSKSSTANRLKVGAVIYDNGIRTVTGRNHMPVGYPPECDHPIFTEEGDIIGSESYPNVIHAELQCILTAAALGVSLHKTVMYITDSPCIRCAELIVAVGIRAVVYDREYRIKDGIEYLKKNGVKVYQINEAPEDI